MTKIALMSDTHGILPDPSHFVGCDIILHAGDIGPDMWDSKNGVQDWVRGPFKEWCDTLPCPLYATLGNHDRPGNWKDWTHDIGRNCHIVLDGLVTTHGLRVWFSPWSVTFGNWAWMAREANLVVKYEKIPRCIDIIVSHTPPWGNLGGVTASNEDAGSVALTNRIRDLLDEGGRLDVVCGHIHEGCGEHSKFLTRASFSVYNVSLMDVNYQFDVNRIRIIER